MSETILNAYQETITWTKEQQSCLNYTGNKTLMVKGFAGAGKSLVIQELAKRLMAGIATGQKHKVAIFSYNNTLNTVTKDILKINGEREDYITVTTLMSYLTRVYKAIGGPYLKLCTGDNYHEIKQEAIQIAIAEHKKKYGSHRLHDLDSSFWIDEFDWMKDMNVSTQDEEYYLRLQRKGRGNKVRMLTADRKAAFQLFTFYDQAIAKKKVGDWTDYALYIIRHAERIPDELKFDYVLIDEAQDLSLTYMIAAMMFFKKDMIIAIEVL